MQEVSVVQIYRLFWLRLARMSEMPPRRSLLPCCARQEEAVRARPDDGPILCVLGLIDAALGRKEDALGERRRALELAPIAKDSLDGADVLYFYAVICAWTGERDLAIEQLKTLAKIPAGPSYGDLRLSSYWDSLRGDPRFEKIVASLAPR